MNDNDVREMFRRRESDVHAPAAPSSRLIYRTKRRQVGFVAMTAVSAAALLLVGILGVSLLRSPEPVVPAPSPEEAATQTVTIGMTQVTFPDGWALLATRGDGIFADLQLTNFDPGSSNQPPCSLGAPAFPADGVMLTISAGGDASAPAWPQPLLPVTDGTDCGDTRLAASWIDPIFAIPMTAEATLGSNAVDEDALRSTFDSLRFVGGDDQIGIGPQRPGAAPTLILAGGETSSKSWTFGLTSDASNGWTLDLGSVGRGMSFSNTETPTPSDMVASTAVLFGNEVVFGAVDPSVARVELRPDGREPVDAELLPVPASAGAPFIPFVAQLPGAPNGTITLIDGAGTTIATYRLAPEAYFSSAYPRSGDTHAFEPGEAFVDGGDAHPWKIAATAEGIALFDETAQEISAVSLQEGDPLSFATGTVGNDTTWLFGIVDPRVTLVQMIAGKGEIDQTTMQSVPLADGTAAFWGGWGDGAGIPDGVLVATDGDCNVVASIDVQSGSSVTPPPGLSCDSATSGQPAG
jgi:hypothetical protein